MDRAQTVPGQVQRLQGREGKGVLRQGVQGVAGQVEGPQRGEAGEDEGVDHVQAVVAEVQVEHAEEGPVVLAVRLGHGPQPVQPDRQELEVGVGPQEGQVQLQDVVVAQQQLLGLKGRGQRRRGRGRGLGGPGEVLGPAVHPEVAGAEEAVAVPWFLGRRVGGGGGGRHGVQAAAALGQAHLVQVASGR